MATTVFKVFCFLTLTMLVHGGVMKRQVLGVKLQDITTNVNCPSGWDPSPCTCRDGPSADQASVFCDNATTGDEIKAAFEKLEGSHKFGNFFMAGSNVEAFPAGVFAKAGFEMFFISNTKLGILDDAAFQGSEDTAKNFLLQNNNFESFNFKALQPLKQLQNFELSRDKVRAIPDEAFGEKPVEVIDLNDNQIQSLGKNAFAKLPKLRKIDLSNNQLSELVEDSFHLSPDVSPISLLLSSNQISKIDKNAFKNVKVRVMEIEDNKLEFLDKDVFEPIVKSLDENHGSLSTLGNPFTCDQASTKWVADLPGFKRGLIIGYMCRDGRALQQVEFT